MLTDEQSTALEHVAKVFGWDKMPLDQVRLILWCAFHYYARRFGR